MTEFQIDLRDTVKAKADQWNADDLMPGPKVIRITGVKRVDSVDQPTWIFFEGDGGLPYKPCKTMRRALGLLWGWEGAAYIGRGIKLYRDPEAVFGGDKVGGIRFEYLSHITETVTLQLTTSRNKRKPFTFHPLTDEEFPTKSITTEESKTRGPSGYDQAAISTVDELKLDAEEAAKDGIKSLEKWFRQLKRAEQKLVSPFMSEYKEMAEERDAIMNEGELGPKEIDVKEGSDEVVS